MSTSFSLRKNEHIQILETNSLLSEIDNKEILQAAKVEIEKGFTNFVVDLSKMNFVNSVGLSFLINLLKLTEQKGGKLILANANDTIVKLLEMTKLRQIFALKPSVDEALNSFSSTK